MIPDDALPEACLWPLAEAGEALEALARAAGLSLPVAAGAACPSPQADFDAWVRWAGRTLGVEAVPASTRVADLPAALAHAAPALLRITADGTAALLVLAGMQRGQAVLLCRDGQRRSLPVARLVRSLTAAGAARCRPDIDRVMASAGIAASRTAAVRAAMTAQHLAATSVDGLTLLRLPAAAPLPRQAALMGLWRRLALIVGLFLVLYAGEIWSWRLIGGATLSGQLDQGWMIAWLLLAFTIVPVRLLARWAEARFALDTGRLVKSRLLAGALALPANAVKRLGVGDLIGRVMEAQALETLVLGGGFGVLVGIIECLFAGWVLTMGAAPVAHLVQLALFALLTLLLAGRSHGRIARWSTARLGLTNHLVEAMIGHRTRLAQERAWRRDAAEDGQLAAYLASAGAMDGAAIGLGSGLASGWLLAGLALLAPALTAPQPPAPALLAISIGGLILGQRALAGIGNGLSSLSRAGFAWGQVRGIVRLGQRPAQPGLAPGLLPVAASGAPVLEAAGLAHAHGPGLPQVLAGVDLSIAAGDRILIEGPSGGGKSTLAGLLAGQGLPDGGMVLLNGLDAHSIGEEWPALVALAPQFHDNHILSGPLAFNLLMGRQWPPTPADLADARDLCERLGLGELLQRMPGGLFQPVGETGWQLSHGERSRIFLARALLQRARVTILDESFASLDPATMARCLDTALAEAQTLVVIAHP